MQVGIFARTFSGTDTVAAARAAGFDAVHFNLACLGGPAMPDALPEGLGPLGLPVVGLSGTYNMIHPDPAIRADGLRRLGIVIAAARALGTGLVTLCTGTRDPHDPWRHHPGNAAPDAWADLTREMAAALEMAEAAGVDLGVEPELANVVASAPLAARLVAEMGSPRLRIVLDPANLFEVATPQDRRRLVEAAVDLLGPRIAQAHAKDRGPGGAVVAAGTGVIDFPHFAATLRAGGYGGSLVAHGLAAEDAPAVATFLRGVAG